MSGLLIVGCESLKSFTLLIISLFCSLTLPYCCLSYADKLANLGDKAVSKEVTAVFTAIFSAAVKKRLSKFVNGIVIIFKMVNNIKNV